MSNLFVVGAILGLVAVSVAAAALLMIALMLRGIKVDATRYLARISGQVSAAKELVRRYTTGSGQDPNPNPNVDPPSPRWADLYEGRRPPRKTP